MGFLSRLFFFVEHGVLYYVITYIKSLDTIYSIYSVYLFISTGRKLVTVKQATDGCARNDEIFSHCGRDVGTQYCTRAYSRWLLHGILFFLTLHISIYYLVYSTFYKNYCYSNMPPALQMCKHFICFIIATLHRICTSTH